MVGVPSFRAAKASIPALQRLGYLSRGWFGLPGRWYFVRAPRGIRTHQIHLVVYGGTFWRRHLLFRDYLRAHPDAARRYASLKRRLAKTFRHRRDAYTRGKNGFIQTVLRTAQGV